MTRRAYLPGLAPEPTPEPEQLGLGIEPERDEARSQWFTPPALADALVDLVADQLRGDGLRPTMSWGVERLRILEPSAGSGAIVRALRRRTPQAWVEAVEIDPRWKPALDEARPSVTRIGDYLEMPAPAQRYDLAVSNPPFTGGVEAAHVAKMLDESNRAAVLLPTRGLHGCDRHEAIWRRMGVDWWMRQIVYLVRRPAFGAAGGIDECVLLDLSRDRGPCEVRWM